MSKKFFAAVAIAALMGVGGYFAKSATTQNDGLSDLQLQNAEALAYDGEAQMKACDTYCRNYSGYICWLQTAAGYKINCDNMAAWNFIG